MSTASSMADLPKISIAATPFHAATPIAVPAAHAPEKTFASVLHAFGEETRKGEKMMEQASNVRYRRDLSAAELLALQAGVYRYSEVVDLATKLVDRVAQGAKTIVQSGGQ